MFKFTIHTNDIVTAYKSGFWKVTKIDKRTWDRKITPLVYLKKIVDLKGNAVKGKREDTCDISFCRPLEWHLKEERKRLTLIIETVKKHNGNNKQSS